MHNLNEEKKKERYILKRCKDEKIYLEKVSLLTIIYDIYTLHSQITRGWQTADTYNTRLLRVSRTPCNVMDVEDGKDDQQHVHGGHCDVIDNATQ